MRGRGFPGALILLGWLMVASLSLPVEGRTYDKPTRDQTEKAIRASVYEMMKAFLMVDVQSFKRRATQRTLNLVSLVYEAAREDPRFQDELRTARVTNPDEFLRFFLQGMANQYLQAAPISPEQAAKRVSTDAGVSFTTGSEAKIIVGDSEFARAKLVAKEWKIDLTESLKKAVLREVTSPEMRARIKSF
jgi:hypothetical protein